MNLNVYVNRTVVWQSVALLAVAVSLLTQPAALAGGHPTVVRSGQSITRITGVITDEAN